MSRRETEVVALIVGGYTNKEIAKRIAVSEQTVTRHLARILSKLGVANRLELILFALDHHLTDNVQKSPE
jgi:DNA-binding NarL/FixJ family response regulator